MNIDPKPNTSPGTDGAGAAFGFAAIFGSAGAAGLGAAGLATAFGAGLAAGLAAVFDASAAGAAAAFFGAALAGVAFFGAADAAVLVVAADLLFVVTVLAFSVLGKDAGAVDFGAAGFDLAATFAVPGFATGFAFALALAGAGFAGSDLASAFAGVGLGATGALGAGLGMADSAGLAGAIEVSADAVDALCTAAVGLETSGFAASTATGFATGAAFSAGAAGAAALAVGLETGSEGFSLTAGSVFCAAASISDDVITTRFTGASWADAGAGAVLLLPAAEATFAGAEDFVPDFPEVFCLETAIASTS